MATAGDIIALKNAYGLVCPTICYSSSGIPGPQGPQGLLGPQGPVGPQGIQGIQGLQGIQGIQGLVGPSGEQGIQGIQGLQGTPGIGINFLGSVLDTSNLPIPVPSQGDAYTVINTGYHLWISNGTAWVDGGPLQGPQGIQGLQGIQGIQGIQGPIGPQGIQGVIGFQGVPGPQGLQGIPGIGINFLGSVTDTVNLPLQPQPQGNAYTVVNTGYHLWISNGIAWIDAGPLQGPQGIPGLQGIQGIQGVIGPQGIPGLQGPSGEQGIQGPQGIQGIAGIGINFLGSVLDTSNLPIPVPSQGDAYTVVNTGYHLWVSNGTAWVDAGPLQGPQGPSGEQGIPGTQGIQGIQGLQGIQGIQGPSGEQGIPGGTFAPYYGSFSSTITIPVTGSNIPTLLTYNTTHIASGISYAPLNPSRIVIANTGIYNFGHVIQLAKTGGQEESVYIWMRKNGVDIPGTTNVINLSGNLGKTFPFDARLFSAIASDYFEVVFASSQGSVNAAAFPAFTSPFTAPSNPSIFTTVYRVG